MSEDDLEFAQADRALEDVVESVLDAQEAEHDRIGALPKCEARYLVWLDAHTWPGAS